MLAKTLPDERQNSFNIYYEDFPHKFLYIYHKMSGYKQIIPQYMKSENGFDYDDIKFIKNEIDMYNADIIQGLELDKNIFHSIE